jgi:dimethylargininase
MPVAITRGISPRFAECELTHLGRTPIDMGQAEREHAAYVLALRGLGLDVITLPAAADLPDCVFVEDAAVVLPECAVITRPGAASRRAETTAVAAALQPWRQLLHIREPGTLDGGDVLVLDKHILVGAGGRSNAEGIAQLGELLTPWGYRVEAVPLHGCLHLKSAVTQVSEDTVLLNPAWVEPGLFAGWRCIGVDPSEPDAANALLIGAQLIYARHHVRTRERLIAAGIHPLLVDASEVAKAEGAVTCCSLICQDP